VREILQPPFVQCSRQKRNNIQNMHGIPWLLDLSLHGTTSISCSWLRFSTMTSLPLSIRCLLGVHFFRSSVCILSLHSLRCLFYWLNCRKMIRDRMGSGPILFILNLFAVFFVKQAEVFFIVIFFIIFFSLFSTIPLINPVTLTR
jgi:hypothetical protein